MGHVLEAWWGFTLASRPLSTFSDVFVKCGQNPHERHPVSSLFSLGWCICRTCKLVDTFILIAIGKAAVDDDAFTLDFD